MQNKKRVLLISSANPIKGPGAIGLDVYNAFKEYGCEVDFLTLYKVDSIPDVKYIYKNPSKWRNLAFKLFKFSRRLLSKSMDMGHCFFYKKETHPPVQTSKILQKIKKPYDIVFVFFCHGMLSFQTIGRLYDKLKCQFVFYCADFSPMSGGCHFIKDCQQFKTGCGCCPAFGSLNPNDFTHWNVMYRKRIYAKVKPIVMANTYMIESFMKKSYLLKDQKLQYASILLDLDRFRPQDKEKLYAHFDIPKWKKYIISFGCQSLTDERKGMSYLLKALDILYQSINEEKRSQILLLFIGNNGIQIEHQLKFDYKNLGYLPISELPNFYSVSTLFLCASVNDAGPSMLCQSIACGTPLVAFEMGAALDILRGYNTGYCAKLRDSKDLAKGVLSILDLDEEKYQKMRVNCRDMAAKKCSKEALVNKVLEFIK